MYESEFEKNLYQQRRDKLQQIAALGQQNGLTYAEATYPNSYEVSAPGWTESKGALIPWLKKQYDSTETPVSGEQLEGDRINVAIAGRIMAIRVQGKAGFAQLQQGGQRFQIYVRKDDVGENAFALYKLLDLGDHIGVRGHLFRTRTGELTVHVEQVDNKPAITFLTKAMLALPDKYHGLEDTELRYRQRYVDLFMNTGNRSVAQPPKPVILSEATGGSVVEGPAVEAVVEETPNVREVFVKRAAVLRAIRTFFDHRGYLEVETPMMHQVAGGAAAQPFTTHHNALDLDLFLRIAPELYLKRLVVGGLDRVYEINRNFRNEGISTRHNPEFTMLEFYQAYANYHDLMKLSEELIIFVAKEVNGTTITHFNGHEIDLGKWTKLSMREAIIKFWPNEFGSAPSLEVFQSASAFEQFLSAALQQLRIHYPQIETPSNEVVGVDLDRHRYLRSLLLQINGQLILLRGNFEAFAILGTTLGVSASAEQMQTAPQELGKTIAGVFEAIAEPHLIQPTIIYDFPLAVSPLSKKKPDEPDWVERFEFYIGGFEVGNAFSELNDPVDQLARFEAQMAEKNRGDKEAMDMDEDYVRALGYGLPPTAGEGIGIDRLTMLLTDSNSIRDVILFPLMRPQQKTAEQLTAKDAQLHGESGE